MFTPTVRKPTGIPAAPLIMVSGPAKSGKSLTSYKLGLSDLIDNCWVCDLGEGSADEYGDIGGYSVLDWGRNWVDLADTIRWCISQPSADGKMNALIIDSGTEMWDGLKDRASNRARNSKKNRAELAKDPDFEVDVSMPFWNDAKETWARIVTPLKLAGNMIGVILVRGDEVAEVVNGAPTNRKVISLQCEKSLPAIVTAHVQIRPDHTAHLIEVRSAKVSVPPQGKRLGDNPLAEVIALMSPAEGSFAVPNVHKPEDDERERDESPYVDPAEARAVELFEAIKALNAPDKASFAAWASQAHHRVTVPEMAGNASLRSSVAKELERLALAAELDAMPQAIQ